MPRTSKRPINWRKVWNEFDKWFEKDQNVKCPKCNRIRYDLQPEWNDQAKKIEELVENQLKPS